MVQWSIALANIVIANYNNKMEKQAAFEAPKTMKTFVYTVLLLLGISEEDFLKPCKPSRVEGSFGVHM